MRYVFLKKRGVPTSEGPPEVKGGITSERRSRSDKAEMERFRVVLTICWIHGGFYGWTHALTRYGKRSVGPGLGSAGRI
jgi:hypothetical protein